MLCWRLLAAVGTPQGIHGALAGTGEQQEQRDDTSHAVIMLRNDAATVRDLRRPSGGTETKTAPKTRRSSKSFNAPFFWRDLRCRQADVYMGGEG